MTNCKKPIKRSILVQLSLVALVICVFISLSTFYIYSSSIFHAYETRMSDILTYISSNIDVDDLSNCVAKREKSSKYVELEKFMDDVLEYFDVHYLYIVTVIDQDSDPKIMDVLTAQKYVDRESSDEDYLTLGYICKDEYSPEDARLHLDAMNGNKLVFMKVDSSWSVDYTGLIPLIDSEGNHFALLGIDVDISNIYSDLLKYSFITFGVAILLGILYVICLDVWLTKNVSHPIVLLEQSVTDFSKKAHQQKDPEQIKYIAPNIQTRNEIQSLTEAITALSYDIRKYIQNILEAENKVTDLKEQVSYMDMMAYQDSLTRVKNKAWYDKTQERINDDIKEGTAEFGIIMMDLNNLKYVNDNYGHERGNDYIFGSCRLLCEIFAHSAVYRVGGDEFVVLLEKLDYNNRDILYNQALSLFAEKSKDTSVEPWERYSASLGMSIFNKETDTCMADVFKRADTLMYNNKQASKLARK